MTNAEKSDLQWKFLLAKMQEHKIVKAFELFRENDIEPILVKGWAAARFYPATEKRVFVDIDLCVEPGLYKKAKNLSESVEGRKLNIDLHSGLRNLDTVLWKDLFENSLLVDLNVDLISEKIRILRPEDHLRVLCCHWLNDGGVRKNRLWDIYYAVANRPENFDWDRCLHIVDKKRRRWIISCIGIAHKYIGLKIDDLPFAAEAEQLPEWLTRSLEKEWKQDISIIPLAASLSNRQEFFTQLRKRFPPNPVQATIEVEGEIDDGTRFFYQIEDVFLRMKWAFARYGKNVLKSFFYFINKKSMKKFKKMKKEKL